MPKRTNDFQHLIALIERELAESNVTVVESALLPDGPSRKKREIDILIKAEVNGHIVTIALECRDHTSPQDVKWIDQLIGKYRDIQVNKVVAVSRSGFTKAAIEKAGQNKIEALSLRQALDTDWPSQFIKPHIKFLTNRHTLVSGLLKYKGKAPGATDGEVVRGYKIVDSTGKEDGTAEQVMLKLYQEGADPSIRELLALKEADVFKTDQDKHFYVDVTYNVTDRFLVTNTGDKYELSHIYLKLLVEFNYVPGANEHYFYNSSQITVGSMPINDGRDNLSVTVVQFARQDRPRFSLLSQKVEPAKNPDRRKRQGPRK